MSKFALSGTQTSSQVPRAVQRYRTPINANQSVVSSTVQVVTPASVTVNKHNLAGGVSYSMSDKMEFTTTCLSWAMLRKKDGAGHAYETEAARTARIHGLVPKVGGEYAAKTAVMLRIMDGGRSISHILAAFIAPYASGEPWAEDFYYQVAVRPDDMCEIVAAIWKFNGKLRSNQDAPNVKKMKLPRALVRGFARRFVKFALDSSGNPSEYRLAKYANKSSNPSLKQLMQMIHPKPQCEAMARIFEKLLTNKLVNTNTWEAQLSAAGQEGKDKGEAWADLVAHQKLGPLALLKNLRNIGQYCTTDIVTEACNQLRDAQTIKNCGILPAQYLTAYSALDNTPNCVKLKLAVDDSVEIASGNIPSIGRRVLIAIDESGSMRSASLTEAAAIFAASLLKSNPDADVMFFANTARFQGFNRKLPIMELIKEIVAATGNGGTNFNTIFQTANKPYDTIVILSDQEGWMGYGYGASFVSRGAPTEARQAYVNRMGVNPLVISMDLGGDGSLMFREDSIITVAGNSFLVFKLLSYLKMERSKLVDIIDSVEIGKPMPSLSGDEE